MLDPNAIEMISEFCTSLIPERINETFCSFFLIQKRCCSKTMSYRFSVLRIRWLWIFSETIQRSFVAALRYAHLSPLGDGTPSSKRRVLLLFANGPEKYIEQANTYARWLTDARVQVHEKLLACD